jgi:hypothetical protein
MREWSINRASSGHLFYESDRHTGVLVRLSTAEQHRGALLGVRAWLVTWTCVVIPLSTH